MDRLKRKLRKNPNETVQDVVLQQIKRIEPRQVVIPIDVTEENQLDVLRKLGEENKVLCQELESAYRMYNEKVAENEHVRQQLKVFQEQFNSKSQNMKEEFEGELFRDLERLKGRDQVIQDLRSQLE